MIDFFQDNVRKVGNTSLAIPVWLDPSGGYGLTRVTDEDCVKIGYSGRYNTLTLYIITDRVERALKSKSRAIGFKSDPWFCFYSVFHKLQPPLPAMAAGKSSAVHGNADDESIRQRKPLNEPAGAYVTEHGREMDKKLEQHQS